MKRFEKTRMLAGVGFPGAFAVVCVCLSFLLSGCCGAVYRTSMKYPTAMDDRELYSVGNGYLSISKRVNSSAEDLMIITFYFDIELLEKAHELWSAAHEIAREIRYPSGGEADSANPPDTFWAGADWAEASRVFCEAAKSGSGKTPRMFEVASGYQGTTWYFYELEKDGKWLVRKLTKAADRQRIIKYFLPVFEDGKKRRDHWTALWDSYHYAHMERRINCYGDVPGKLLIELAGKKYLGAAVEREEGEGECELAVPGLGRVMGGDLRNELTLKEKRIDYCAVRVIVPSSGIDIYNPDRKIRILSALYGKSSGESSDLSGSNQPLGCGAKDKPVNNGVAPECKTVIFDLGNKVTMRLVRIPSGKFIMGSPASEKGRDSDEGPQREVTISKPFYMGPYEVTQEQYEQVMGANPSFYKSKSKPVEQVSWDDAVSFCQALSRKTGKTVRLPTEAEWEYACRAGSTTRLYYGDDLNYAQLSDYAWYWRIGSSSFQTHPVGQKKPNAFGLYDMAGNVFEWCSDWYANNYANAETQDPQGPDTGTFRIQRGGGAGGTPGFCHSAKRRRRFPDSMDSISGFRVVVVPGDD